MMERPNPHWAAVAAACRYAQLLGEPSYVLRHRGHSVTVTHEQDVRLFVEDGAKILVGVHPR